MEPFVWKDRLVKIEDDNFVLSARGRHDDFDFFSGKDDCAVCGNPGEHVYDIEVVDDDHLRLICGNSNYILHGDDFTHTAQISREAKTPGR